MPSGLFQLPTEPVDNSVDKRFIGGLTDGFYYSFVTLDNFKTADSYIYISTSYKTNEHHKMTLQVIDGNLTPVQPNLCI